jgi:hypothetical protein
MRSNELPPLVKGAGRRIGLWLPCMSGGGPGGDGGGFCGLLAYWGDGGSVRLPEPSQVSHSFQVHQKNSHCHHVVFPVPLQAGHLPDSLIGY